VMQLDRDMLDRHASFVAEGVEERAFIIPMENERCFAQLYTGEASRGLGFLICHSYGLEMITLRRTERAVARTLAGEGYPVLSIHRRGYGDSSGALADSTPQRELEDLRAATAHLAAETGTSRLGLIGAKFGGLLAAYAARDGSVDHLILMNPAVRGDVYLREFVRERLMVDLAARANDNRRSIEEVLQTMRQDGAADVLGYPIHRRLFDPLSEVDLAKDMGHFTGDSLLFQVSKRASLRRDLAALRDRLAAQGGRCRLEFVREPPGVMFGGVPFVSTTDPASRIDLQQPIVDEIVRITKEWITS
jgi:pimeloyl-ACP methyl ester carboxylesterase